MNLSLTVLALKSLNTNQPAIYITCNLQIHRRAFLEETKQYNTPRTFFLEETNGAFWTLSWLIWFVVKLPDALMVGWACVFTSVNWSQVCEKQSWKGKTNESAAQFSHHNFVINKQQGPSRFEFLFFFNIKERPKEDTFKSLWLKGRLTDFYVGIK